MQTTVLNPPCTPQSAAAAHDVETLAAELRGLLTRHSHILKEEGVRRQMENLEYWVKSQKAGPAPACIISEGGIAWLRDLHDRLKLSADETLRLEGEGGNPPTREQSEKMEELMKTIRRIERIIEGSTTVKAN